MSTYNYGRSRRLAHNFGRAGEATGWNPFAFRNRQGSRDQRAKTWHSGADEQQSHDGHLGQNQPLTHAATAPSISNDVIGSQLPAPVPSSDSGHFGHGTKQGANDDKAIAFDDDGAGLRNRRHDDDGPRLEASRDSAHDDGGQAKKKRQDKNGLIRHVEPKTPFTVANQIQRTVLNSWINILIVAAPVGIAINYVDSVNRIAVFVVNFIAIVPLAAMLGFATEEIALRTGETLGGLLNATFGNAVELIVAVIALKDDKVDIVKTSLIGSILSNLLLVMGCCFFFGGLRRSEQYFNTTVAQTAASLLALAAASVIVPTVFDTAQDTGLDKVAGLSRGTAVILLCVYAAYLFFQLKTHQTVFAEESQKVPAKPWSSSGTNLRQALVVPSSVMSYAVPNRSENERLSQMLMNPMLLDDDDDEEEPQLHFLVALGTLTISTVIIALCAEYMVDSIDAVTRNGALSIEFVGLILLPIVGNAAEHATAVTVAIKDKMDLAIGVAIGSSMQVSLFLIPLLVVIGWGMGKDEMNLSFDSFQMAVMFVAVLLTNYLIGDGKSHWLEGFLLICLYAIIAVCSFYYPDSAVGHS
ncbi:hypothetical protein CDD81_1218 [Ophiocordyceps australis]|uniref:Sodium/calcium exchanger membrane region domain-containing protein n=1 Tax=Ophiocordyceps australis TaxID=1399860 RepID=A0A2C5XBA7_9HYPO|nr:hypothetical protein CDD81_1218 [Ophiocordyceps australis]